MTPAVTSVRKSQRCRPTRQASRPPAAALNVSAIRSTEPRIPARANSSPEAAIACPRRSLRLLRTVLAIGGKLAVPPPRPTVSKWGQCGTRLGTSASRLADRDRSHRANARSPVQVASTCSGPTNGDSSSSSNGATSMTWKRSLLPGDDLLARPDHLLVGGLTENVPVGRMEPVPEHVSSDPGRGRRDEPISGRARGRCAPPSVSAAARAKLRSWLREPMTARRKPMR